MRPSTAPAWLSVRVVHGAGVGCLIAIGAGVWMLGMGPAVQSRADSERLLGEINHKKIRALELETQTSTRSKLVETLEATMSGGIELEGSDQKNSRLAALADLAERSGLVIDEIKPGPTTPGELYDTHKIEMRGRGGYAASAAYLHRLVTEFSDMAAIGFEIGALRASQNSGGTFRFDLAWYSDPAGDG